MTEVLRVAVLSDIHAGDAQQGDTFVVSEPPASRAKENPLRDLVSYLDGLKTSVDVIVCPGDLTNRADPGGRMYGWSVLQEIGLALGTDVVVATVGNHDVVTRTPAPDPAQMLKLLHPLYPSSQVHHSQQYWTNGFYIDDSDPRFRILNVDTCADFPAHPGLGAADAALTEHSLAVERGAVSADRIAQIEHALQPLDEKTVNIALMHHHPVEHARHDLFKDTYGAMVNGDALVDVLERSSNCGRWMLIHGHKHIPSFTVDGGSANSPMVLCAASVGHHLWQPISSVTRNQFHIIEFEIDPVVGLPRTRGHVKSWAWSFGNGWTPAPPTTGLPASFGFGSLHDPRDLAAQVAALMVAADVEFERWDVIQQKVPLLKYVGSKDLQLFEDRLADSDFVLERDREFSITTVAKRATWT